MPEPKPELFGVRLRSALQPILSLSHRRVIGYEGLLRGTDTSTDAFVPPGQLFHKAESIGALTSLERTSQRLHVESFHHRLPEPAPMWLFLNVSPRLISEESYRDLLPEVLEARGMAGHQIVVELLEDGDDGSRGLAEAVTYFRELGCLVALDDFGTGHSNFQRLWELEPDLVKLDRSLIVRATESPGRNKLRRILPNLVALIHEAGSLVVMEGIESEDQALIAMDADVDFVQGFHFAYPETGPVSRRAGVEPLRQVTERFTNQALASVGQEQAAIQPYVRSFLRAAIHLQGSGDLEDSCRDLLGLDRVQRCYLLNERGEQVGPHLTRSADEPSAQSDPRHRPLVDTVGGTWLRRPYFRDALMEPRRLKVSRPYLSSTGSHVCVTLSVAEQSRRDGSHYVFCCDLLWWDRPEAGRHLAAGFGAGSDR